LKACFIFLHKKINLIQFFNILYLRYLDIWNTSCFGWFIDFENNHQFWIFLKNHNQGTASSMYSKNQCVNLPHVKCIISVEVIPVEEAKNWRWVTDLLPSPKLCSVHSEVNLLSLLIKWTFEGPPVQCWVVIRTTEHNRTGNSF
jgi:hypothetical protein